MKAFRRLGFMNPNKSRFVLKSAWLPMKWTCFRNLNTYAKDGIWVLWDDVRMLHSFSYFLKIWFLFLPFAGFVCSSQPLVLDRKCRFSGDRLRPRRIRRRNQSRTTGHEDGMHWKAAHSWRHLSQCRLHPLQSTPQQLTLLSHGEIRRSWQPRSRIYR